MTTFFYTATAPGVQLALTYDIKFVLISIGVAIISSILALQVASLARQSRRQQVRQIALLSGALAMGGGIWSMHFIGMLALKTGLHIHYDTLITLASILPSIFASWVALSMLANERIDTTQLALGGALMGVGIGAMHYSGMMAMHTDAAVLYEPLTFSASIVAAVFLAIFALWVKFKLQNYFTQLTNTQTSILAGSVMGIAIAAMHYIGMAAARIMTLRDYTQLGSIDTDLSALVMQIGGATLALSTFVLFGNLLLRYRELNNQLSLSESRIRAIVETAVDGIISIDGRGRIIAMNGAAERLFGWKLEDILHQNVKILMPEPFHSEHDGYLANFFKGEAPRVMGVGREVIAKRKDGSEVPIRLAVGKADLPDQHLFVGFVSDISERIKMEREILARETQYRTLISNMPGVAFRIEATAPWRTLFVSDAITKLSGWAPEIFTEQQLSLASITHPDDYERVHQKVLEALRTDRPYTIEFRMIDRFGHEHWVSQSASAVLDAESQSLWLDGVIIDITDRKRRNAEFESIVRSIGRSLLFIEFDLSGRALEANDNFLKLVGYSRQELLRLHYRDLVCSLAHEETPAEFWATLEAGDFHAGEYCLKGREGRRIWMQATFNPILDSTGKPWKVVALGNDLSHRKAMETDLFIAKNKAEQASIAKGLFLANMSHEIRTPMNAIIGFTELLLDATLAPDQHKQLRTIHQSARSLLGLLNDILDTAKLERGTVELENHSFSLRELVQQIVQEQWLNAEKKGLVLRVDYPADIRDQVEGDALRLKQILLNLVGNAVKFTEQGEVVVRVRSQDSRMIFKVVDTGIGIASDRLAHIFTPFTQADASMARRFGGTGLGTTIARQLAELMGGSVTAASLEGKGSTFTLEIPLPASDKTQPPCDTSTVTLPPLRVLIADDVPENLELLTLILQRDHHQVMSAVDGQEAFKNFTQNPFDLVLMDVQMPRMDGLEATRLIRQWEQEKGLNTTPIIALTASVLERDRKQAAAAGMSGFASKPINVHDLLREMGRCLGLTTRDVPLPQAEPTLPAIDWDSAIARWGDRDTLMRHLRTFTRDFPEQIAQLQHTNPASLPNTLHRVKGVAANLGLTQLAQCLSDAEHNVEGDIARLAQQLSQALAAVCETLEPQVLVATPAPSPETETAPDLAGIDTLIAELNHGEINDASLAAFTQLMPASTQDALREAVDNFDLSQAAALLDAWRRSLN